MEASTSRDPIRPGQDPARPLTCSESLTRLQACEHDTEAGAEPLFSPIDQLPNEILSRIFEYCCPVDIGRQNPSIMRVCSRWKSVAISAPHVWTHVELNLVPTTRTWRRYPSLGRVPSYRIDENRRYPSSGRASSYRSDENLPKPRLLSLHLGYSKALPLVTVHISLADDRRPQVIECLQMIIQHASRWTSLQLSFDESLGFETVEYLNTIQTLPLLQSFICLTRENPPDQRFSFSRIFEKVARGKLQKLVLAHFNSDGVGKGFSLPSVTQLVLHFDMQSSDIFSVVRYCPRLVHLKYIINELRDRSALSRSSVLGTTVNSESQTVKTLQIELGERVQGRAGRLFAELIKSLNLPSLTSMTISTTKQSKAAFQFMKQWPAQEFNDFFARSGCDLETLELNSVSLADYQVMYLLLKAPRLVDLSIQEIPRLPRLPQYSKHEEGLDFPVTRFLLRELRICRNVKPQKPLAPKLKRLRLNVNASVKEPSGEEVAFDEGVFEQMVWSRSLPPIRQQETAGLPEEDASIVPPSLDDSDRCLKDVQFRVYEHTQKRN
ncbi:hypothetical protein K435DRAFT_774383 [Dendrothele bispora CBS 962.96]|uniref:F-box domain-containing protein n=1 Tax=Dendrothele bispora (strain CBS 962.96) TaxID=1314807 RepID=A0A4S8MNM7_DENBC|nr:hypothetical protein K435DRAFT_774383 [Dendrothele bispora CBS 962.96]